MQFSLNLIHSSSLMENIEKKKAVDSTQRLNFQYNGSDLYDSFEFKQITIQLNEAIQTSNASSPASQEMTHKLNKFIRGSSASSPARPFHLNSPFYRHHLNRIYKESSKTPRRISGPQPQEVPDKRTCRRGAREKGFVTCLWMRVKKSLFGKKHESGEGRNRPSKAY